MMGSREPNGGLYPNRSYTQHTTQALDKVTTCEPHKSNIRGQNYTKPSNVSRDYEAEHSSEELITHLRIQNAVLESNLKHVTKERDEAINGNILIIKTFSSAIGRADGDSKIRELKDELNKLQLENKILRQHIKAQRVPGEAHESGSSIDNHIHSCTGVAHAEELTSKSRPNSFSKLFDPTSSYNPHMLPAANKTPNDVSIPLNSVPIISRALNADQRASYSDPWEQSFDSNSPTIPNTPIVTSHTSKHPLSAPAMMLAQAITTRDVGFFSLDAAMDSDLTDAPPIVSERPKLRSDPQVDIDEQIPKDLAGLKSITELPKPTVLKAGFDTKGSFKGEEYSAEKAKTQLEHHVRALSLGHDYAHSGTREYNRFIPDSILTRPREDFDPAQLKYVWSSREERDDAIDIHRRATNLERSLPDLFRYGYQYVPGDRDTNYLRTVRIGNIPAEVELRDILARVRGGAILKAVLVNTVKLTGGNTVLVQFLNASSADEYVSYTTVHPISFGDDKQVADIDLVVSPTYPCFHIAHSVRHLEQSRVLAIHHFPKDVSISRLERDISGCNQYRAEALIEIYLDEEGTLHMEFSSVSAAGCAYGILTARHAYKWLFPFFEKDPCVGPVEELELPVRPRPPLIPRSRYDPAFTPPAAHLLQDQVIGIRRKRLAALTNQAVTIPSSSGRQIISDTNWADEVNDEVEGRENNDVDATENHKTIEEAPVADPEPRPFIQGLSPLDDVFADPAQTRNPDEIELDLAEDRNLVSASAPAPASLPPAYHLSLPTLEAQTALFPTQTLARSTNDELNSGTVVRKSRGRRTFAEEIFL